MRCLSRQLATFFVASSIAGTALFASALAEEPDSAAVKAHLKALDSGPKTIDVAKYPDGQKAGYKLFAKKCATCHAIARPINSDFVLPAQWQRYIKRMMFKPNSGLNDADGKRIFQFLVYDASVRKRELLKKALSSLSAEERAEAIGKIKATNPAFTAP